MKDFLSLKKSNENDFFARSTTDILRGLATILIFFHHISLQLYTQNVFIKLFSYLGGYGTTIFLFFSGYCNLFSIKKDSEKWIVKRTKNLLADFLICFAVCFLSAFILLKANVISNLSWAISYFAIWYVWIQLLMYLILYVSYKISKRYVSVLVAAFSVLSYVFIRFVFCAPQWWYATMLTFPLGVICADNKQRVFRFFNKNAAWILPAVTVAFVASLYFHIKSAFTFCDTLSYIIFTVLFTAIFSLVNIKFKPIEIVGNNSYLVFLTHWCFLRVWICDCNDDVFNATAKVGLIIICTAASTFLISHSKKKIGMIKHEKQTSKS